MSDSESFASAKDKDYDDKEESSESDDEPLAKKSKTSPAKSTKKTSPKKRDSKKKANKKGRVSFALVPTEQKSNNKGEEEYEVEAIVGHRQYNGKLLYKIRWKNYEPIHDTWESYDSLSCPDILESYNFKHNITIPKSVSKKTNSAKKSSGRKRRSSVSSSDENEENGAESCDEEEYEVKNIVEMRYKKDGTREFLVHWKRWSSDYDTWEPEKNLNCPDLIDAFMKKVETAKNLSSKDLRTFRKHTQRFTLTTRDSGRRLSKRNSNKQRVTYFGTEKSDEED